MNEQNPFMDPRRNYGAVDAEARLDRVRDFDREQCARALRVPGLQKTVERAIHVRQRKLEREAAS